VNVIGTILCVIVLDQKRLALHPIVVAFAFLQSSLEIIGALGIHPAESLVPNWDNRSSFLLPRRRAAGSAPGAFPWPGTGAKVSSQLPAVAVQSFGRALFDERGAEP